MCINNVLVTYIIIINMYMLLYLYLQVVLTVSQIKWCCDLTECLSKEEDEVLEAVQGAENRCFQVRALLHYKHNLIVRIHVLSKI